MLPLLSINPLVAYDVAAFVRLIKSKGGVLGDGIISEQEAIARLMWFVTLLYAIVGGRCDFWPLQEAYQVGFGSKVYSFHGLEGILVNGPTWGPSGVKFVNESQYIEAIIFPDGLSMPSFFCYAGTIDEFVENALLFSTNTSGDANTLFDISSSTDGKIACGLRLDNTGAYLPPASRLSYTVGTPMFVCGGYDPTANTQTFRVDEQVSMRTATSVATSGTRIRINIRSDYAYQGGKSTCAFALFAFKPFTGGMLQTIRSAYKSTIGKDMGLP